MSTPRFHFSQDQRKVLRGYYYDQGMRSTSKSNAELINQVATEIGATPSQINHWINAEQGREKKTLRLQNQTSSPPSESSQDPGPVTAKVVKPRKRSGFQLYCAELAGTVLGDGPTVITTLAQRWATLTSEEKEAWKSRSKENVYTTPVNKKHMVRDLISTIEENCKTLSCLGVEGYAVFLDTSSSDCRVLTSSEQSKNFILAEDQGGQGVDDKFFKFMCGASYIKGKKRKKGPGYDDMLEDVRLDWKQKYCKVTGHGRIPYSAPDKMKCVAVGLPTGVTFKQPAHYKMPELRIVHDSLDNIRFLPIPEPEEEAPMDDCSQGEGQPRSGQLLSGASM